MQLATFAIAIDYSTTTPLARSLSLFSLSLFFFLVSPITFVILWNALIRGAFQAIEGIETLLQVNFLLGKIL